MEYQRDSPSFFVYPRAFSGALFTMSANESPNLSETLSTAYTIRIITRRHTRDTRIALIGVLLETRESVDKLNHLLSDYGEYVIGRMGLPYKEKGIHIISIAVDAPNNIISALSGKLGMLPGVSTKTIYGKTT